MYSAERKYQDTKRFKEDSWDFTFDSWLAMWIGSGHWEHRGVGLGKYVMIRKDQTKSWSPSNCEIVRWEDHRDSKYWTDHQKLEHSKRISELHKGKPKTEEQKHKMRLAKLGKKHSPEHIRKRTESMLRTRLLKRKERESR